MKIKELIYPSAERYNKYFWIYYIITIILLPYIICKGIMYVMINALSLILGFILQILTCVADLLRVRDHHIRLRLSLIFRPNKARIMKYKNET